MATSSYHDWMRSICGTSTGRAFWLIISPILGILCYIALRRLSSHEGKDVSRRRSDGPETMTLEEAYRIKTRIAEHDFPLVFSAATNSVFFKAEGIPSIAKLVSRAVQRSPSSTSSSSPSPSSSSTQPRKNRPSATPLDLLSRPGSPARQAAIDRVNYIHNLYRPSGKMSDDDLLYVLSLFASEPARWIARFEWRALTTRERGALAVLWRDVGRDLGIPFGRLGGCDMGKDGDNDRGKDRGEGESGSGMKQSSKGESEGEDEEGFTDALHWLSELEEWGRKYEQKHRAKSPESVFLGQKQLDAWTQGGVWLLWWPAFARPWARGWVAALVEPGHRLVMGIEDPSVMDVALVESVIYVRKIIQRCLYGS